MRHYNLFSRTKDLTIMIIARTRNALDTCRVRSRGLDSVDFPNWTFQLNFHMIDGGFSEIRQPRVAIEQAFVESTAK